MNKFFLILLVFNFSFNYESLDFEFLKKSKPENNKETQINSNQKKTKTKSFDKLIEGSIKKEGLFDYYWNKDKNKCFLALNKNQLNKTFILNITRQMGDAYRYHGSASGGEFAFTFKKVGSNIQIIQKNLKFRAQKDSAIFKAINIIYLILFFLQQK